MKAYESTVGLEPMVYAWRERPSAEPAEPSANVCDGKEALAAYPSSEPKLASDRSQIERQFPFSRRLSPHRFRLRSAFDEGLPPWALGEEYLPRKSATAASAPV